MAAIAFFIQNRNQILLKWESSYKVTLRNKYSQQKQDLYIAEDCSIPVEKNGVPYWNVVFPGLYYICNTNEWIYGNELKLP